MFSQGKGSCWTCTSSALLPSASWLLTPLKMAFRVCSDTSGLSQEDRRAGRASLTSAGGSGAFQEHPSFLGCHDGLGRAQLPQNSPGEQLPQPQSCYCPWMRVGEMLVGIPTACEPWRGAALPAGWELMVIPLHGVGEGTQS